MFKKCFHLCLFLSLSLLLPFLLYITEGGVFDTTVGVVQDGDCFGLEKSGESRDFSYLLYSSGKDLIIKPDSKCPPEPEPESEPEIDQEITAPVETAAAQEASSQETSQPVISVPAPPPAPQPAPEPEPAPAPQPAASDTTVSLSQKEQQMVNLINEARKNAGLPALQVCSQLTTAARAKSKDMVNKNYFSHSSPTYGDLSSLLKRFGVSFSAAAENLAMNSNGSVSAAHNSLMNSSGHRSNILGRQYNYVGVGISVKSDGSHYYTQLFVKR